MQFIKDKTSGRLTLGAGTLYGALSSLQQKDGLFHITLAEKNIHYYRSWKTNCTE